MASENTLTFTDAAFEAEVLGSEVPVLVDFWAEWCGPCRMMTPTIEALASDYAGKVKIGKMDTDSNRNTAVQYQISAIPTVIVFKGGQPAKKFVGLQGKQAYAAVLNELTK